jgi:hypothetical protein
MHAFLPPPFTQALDGHGRMKRLQKLVGVALLYLASWAAAFFGIVGWQPDLAVSYFYLGWTFQGLELIGLVWLASLVLLAAALLLIAVGSRIRETTRATVYTSFEGTRRPVHPAPQLGR